MKKVLFNSIPKSGTHLLSRSLELLGYDRVSHIGPGPFLNGVFRRHINRIIYRAHRQGYIIGIFAPIEVSKNWVRNRLKKVMNQQSISAHLGYTDSIMRLADKMNFRMIQLIRDPRAIIASLVPFVLNTKSHVLHNFFKKLDHNKRYEVLLKGYEAQRVSIPSADVWCNSINLWLKSKKVLVIKFEDLVGPHGGGNLEKQEMALEKIAMHIGAKIEKIDYVSKNLYGNTWTFRKGKVNSWRDEIPRDLQKRMTQNLRPILEEWEYL